MTIHRLIKLFDAEASQRSHNHCRHQHRNACVAHDCSDHGDCPRNTSAVSADHPSSGRCDQHRNQIRQHRTNHAVKPLIRHPACVDKQRCKKTECNQCADVRHHHSRQKLTEFLYIIFHENPSSIFINGEWINCPIIP